MKERILAWIRWSALPDALRLGWLPVERGPACHHNYYSTLCEWVCVCGREPVVLRREKHG